jgi:hypothetical protein
MDIDCWDPEKIVRDETRRVPVSDWVDSLIGWSKWLVI